MILYATPIELVDHSKSSWWPKWAKLLWAWHTACLLGIRCCFYFLFYIHKM